MKSLFCGFFFTIFWITVGCAQPGDPVVRQKDSLINILNQTSQVEAKLNLLADIASLAERSDIEEALKYLRQGVQLARDSRDAQEPKFYERIGRIHANLMKFDSASLYFEKAMTGYVAKGDKKGEASAWFKKSYISRYAGRLEESLSYNLKALAIMEALKDESGISRAYEEISHDLYEQNKGAEALAYAQKSIATAEKIGDKGQLLYSLGAAGSASFKTKDFKTAYQFMDRKVTLAKEMGFPPGELAPFYNERGNALKLLGRYQEALADYNLALSYSKSAQMNGITLSLEANVGDVYMRMGKYAEALPYKLNAIKGFEKIGFKTNLSENYLHTSVIYEKLGDYKSALAYHKKYQVAKDSLVSIEKDEMMSSLLTKYETAEKDSRLAIQDAQISRQNTLQWAISGIALLLALILFLGYRNFRQKQKSNAQLSAANDLLKKKNQENELLLKEIHHRVKNNLQTISSLLNLQSAGLTDANALEAVRESQNRVRSMGLIHQKLYQGDQLATVEMKDYFKTLGETLFQAFGFRDQQVALNVDMEEVGLDVDTAIPLGLIVNELVTNALKYAFPEGRAGMVKISLRAQDGNTLALRIKDDGVGLQAISNSSKDNGFGSRLVQLLTLQLDGQMEESAKDGFETIIRFKPLAKAA
ncbi:MAG: tetratricopeptide repeat protein [Saprospiraceae bacterium]|nr:tetratricopeptide repeat protein [Saprospiraceae bacterium]